MFMSMSEILDMLVLPVKTPLSYAGNYFSGMRTDPKEILRKNLSAALHRRGTSITALAGTQSHQRTFDRVFKVENWPRLDTLIDVCNALGVEVWQVLWPGYDAASPVSKPLDTEKLRGAINAAVGLAIENKPPTDQLGDYLYGFITDIYFYRHANHPKVVETTKALQAETDPTKTMGSADDRRSGKLPAQRSLVAQGQAGAGVRVKPELARALRPARKTLQGGNK